MPNWRRSADERWQSPNWSRSVERAVKRADGTEVSRATGLVERELLLGDQARLRGCVLLGGERSSLMQLCELPQVATTSPLVASATVTGVGFHERVRTRHGHALGNPREVVRKEDPHLLRCRVVHQEVQLGVRAADRDDRLHMPGEWASSDRTAGSVVAGEVHDPPVHGARLVADADPG